MQKLKLSRSVAASFFVLALVAECTSPGMASVAAAARAVSSRAQLSGHVPRAIERATPVALDPARSDDPLRLTVVLKRGDQAGFDRHLRRVYDPASPQFRRFLAPRELSDRFGPTSEQYDRVRAYLERHGFRLTRGSANRLTLTVEGTRASAERAFGVRIRDYERDGRRFFSNDTEPSVPSSLAESIQAVLGLSSPPEPKPAILAEPIIALLTILNIQLEAETAIYEAAFINGVLDLSAIEARIAALIEMYEILLPASEFGPLFVSPLGARSSNPAGGDGQKVGVLAFSSFLPSDVADWLALAGLPADLIDQVSQVQVNGGAPLGADQTDVLLAVDTILSIAPKAEIAVYEGSFTGPGTSFQTLFNAMIDDGVDVISNSFLYCEDQTTLADVQSIDAILATAAAAGISVLNATGDAGSACANGSPNTVAVPASSPHGTAVGATTPTIGPGGTYGGEVWLDGSMQIPPSGQSGFGASRFFATPAYQAAVNASPMRSVPDVVVAGDPRFGPAVCQASAGGCPTPFSHGGTSLATPIWAAFTALLNESLGSPIGFLNPALYALAGTSSFHSPASMGSDAAHVGLGSPNLDYLYLALAGLTPGAPSASESIVKTFGASTVVPFTEITADGTTAATVAVLVRDQDGHLVPGKTVTLAASAGSSAVITPPSGVSSADNAAVVFRVTNAAVEQVTLIATADGVTLDHTATVSFVGPSAAAGSIHADPTSVPADGVTPATITVLLQDADGGPAPNKFIRLSQGNGHSIIQGPSPSVTDANGQIEFTVTSTIAETVTYTAVDVTDGNLPVPGSASVTFGGSSSGCVAALVPPVGQNGYSVEPWTTGFFAQNFFFSNVNWGGCPGAVEPAFAGDSAFVANFRTGDLFKVGLDGGAVSTGDVLANHGPTLGQPVFGKDGRLYATRSATGGNFNTGAIYELDPTTGQILRTLATGLTCPAAMAVDPISGDLFFDNSCTGAGSDNPSIYRVVDPAGPSPSVVVYATLPATPNGGLTFDPNGTLYAVTGYWNNLNAPVMRIGGTNTPQPPSMQAIPGVGTAYGVRVAEVLPSGDARSLLVHADTGLGLVDITQSPAVETLLAQGAFGPGPIGPDGCVYGSGSDRVYKLTRADGGCGFAPTNPGPALQLTPASVSPDPEQGSTQTFTAEFRNVGVPEGTPVTFTVVGPNLRAYLVRTDPSGKAELTYPGVFTGTDVVVARAAVGALELSSNRAQATWQPGPHTTYVNLNVSPKAGAIGKPAALIASLFDLSVHPPVAIPDAELALGVGAQSCTAVTDASGVATCTITPDAAGLSTLTGSFDGAPLLLPSSSSSGFNVLAPSLDHFLCYKARAAKAPRGQTPFPAFVPRAATIADAFGGPFDFDLKKPLGLCTPASKADEDAGAPAHPGHEESYRIKRVKGAPKFDRARQVHTIRNSLHPDGFRVKLGGEDRLMVPTSQALGTGGNETPPPDGLDHFKCYRITPARAPRGAPPYPKFAAIPNVKVEDQFQTRFFDLKRLTRLCNPADKNGEDATAPAHGEHLVCYQARLSKTVPKQSRIAKQLVSTHNQLGPEVLQTLTVQELCVPSALEP